MSWHGTSTSVPASTTLDLDLSDIGWHTGYMPGGSEQTPSDSNLFGQFMVPSPQINHFYDTDWAAEGQCDYNGSYGLQCPGATRGLFPDAACYAPSSSYGDMPLSTSKSSVNTTSPQLSLCGESNLRYDSPMSVETGINPMSTNRALNAEHWHAVLAETSDHLWADDASDSPQYNYLSSTSMMIHPSTSRRSAPSISVTLSAHSKRPYVCPQQDCNIRFKNSADISRHVRTMHQESRGGFRCAAEGCSKADKIWTRLDSFENHARTQHLDADMKDLVRRSTRTSHGLPVSVMTPAIMSRRTPPDRRARSRQPVNSKQRL